MPSKAAMDHPGPRSWSVSGRVKKPGVVLAPAGITVRQLIDRCGGMADGHKFAAYYPGGASGGVLPAAMGDIALDFQDHRLRLGAANWPSSMPLSAAMPW